MSFEDLKNPELQEKLKSARTPEELLALAKEEGCEFSDEALEKMGLSGGDCLPFDVGLCQTACMAHALVNCPFNFGSSSS